MCLSLFRFYQSPSFMPMNSFFVIITLSFNYFFMEHVAGIGGFFFRSKDPKKMAVWYEENFGINRMKTEGDVWRQESGVTVFTPFEQGSDYYPKDQQCMLNFRVRSMEKMIAQLKKNGVKIDPESQEDTIGKFAWVYDPEGNKIELWEPAV